MNRHPGLCCPRAACKVEVRDYGMPGTLGRRTGFANESEHKGRATSPKKWVINYRCYLCPPPTAFLPSLLASDGLPTTSTCPCTCGLGTTGAPVPPAYPLVHDLAERNVTGPKDSFFAGKDTNSRIVIMITVYLIFKLKPKENRRVH